MKKLFIGGAAALVLGGCLAGCSHEDIDYSSIVDGKLKAYQEVFVDAYGKIDPNQNWGFGTISSDSTTRANNLTRAINLNFSEGFVFPEDAAAGKFLTDVPAGVEKLTENVGRANNWIDETWEGDLDIWGAGTAEGNFTDRSGGTLYIKGNCDFSNRKFYFDGNSELYLLAGATLTLGVNDGSTNLQTNTMIYIAEGATLIANGELMLNNDLHIYNHGTIQAPKLSTNSKSVLYNVGTVTVTNKISVENDSSVVVNDGTITAADLNTAGSGKFQNNGDITISGTTVVNSNQNTWINNGMYHTGYFIYNAASDQVINNCRLTVDEDFNINLGDNPGDGCFRMNAGAGVLTKNFNGGRYVYEGNQFNGGPFYIYMGGGSVFKVTETATMDATKADYGVYNLGDDWSVFQAKNIVAGSTNQGYEVTYGGKLAVIADTHFAQGYSGSYPYIDFKYGFGTSNIFAPGFNEEAPNVNVSASQCSPGVGTVSIPIDQGETTEDKITVVTTKEYYETTQLIEQGRVFCEDLGKIDRNDLDFNDVVFDAYIYKTVASIRTIVTEDGEVITDNTSDGSPRYSNIIVVLAAGGTLPLTIANKYEVHDLLGGNPTSTIINTSVDEDGAYLNDWTEEDPVEINDKDLKYETIESIPIQVQFGNGETCKLEAIQGWAPHKIKTPIGTKWAKERVKIDAAYTKFFNYVNYSEDCWNSGFVQDNLYVHPKDTFEPRSEVPEKKHINTKTETTYRASGNSTTTGGYQGEDVLSRRTKF